MRTSFIFKVLQAYILAIHFVSSQLSSNCSIGCSSCDLQSNQQYTCSGCEPNFQLSNNRCQYQSCPTNTYLQRYITSQNGNSVNTDTCKATCDISYQENSSYNVCDQQEQCPISYIRSTDSTSVGTIESIYQVNDQITMIVYPTYVTLISTATGQYLRDIVSATTLSTLYFKNYLIILSTTNEIIEWIFESNFQRVITKVQIGKLTKKTQFFDLGGNVHAISSFDDSLSIVYFTRVYLDGATASADTSVPQFTYIGCALKIVDAFVLCLGKDSKIIIKKLGVNNNMLSLQDITQSSASQNAIFNTNTIIQSLLIKQDTKQQILLIQQQNSKLIQLVYDQVGAIVDCKLTDLLDFPDKIRLVDQKDQSLLLAIKFTTRLTFYDAQIIEILRITVASNTITDMAFTRDAAAAPMTVYKLIAMQTTLNQVQTFQINISTKTSTPLKTYPLLIKNAIVFLSYNDKNIQSDQLSTLIGTNYLFIANNNLQSVNANTDYTNYIVSPFEQKRITHTDSINEMVHSEDSLFLITCSQDGSVMAWYTLSGLNPSYLYMVRQNNESCRTVLIHQNKWVVALFSRSVLIFLMKNPFIRYSYPFQNPATDVTQFINQFQSHIVLYYDTQFILLNGNDLTEIKRGTYPGSTLLSIHPTYNFNIMVQSATNLLELYQFDSSQSYLFGKVTGKSYQSTQGDYSIIQIDYISSSDFEILLGCKGKSFIILDSSFTEKLVHQISYGFPITIRKYTDNNVYILFGYSLEPNAIYLFFHYAVDRTLNQGTLYSRSYSLKHNLGLANQLDYKGNTNIGYLATMPFSYFTLILKGIYRPSDKTVNYGYFVYSMGKPINKYAVKDNGNIQYYGSQDGILSFDSNNFSSLSRLDLNPQPNDAITKVLTSAYLQSVFVVQFEVDIHNIYTHKFLGQIKFSTSYASEKVISVVLSEKNYIAIAYKSKQLIVRSFIDNSSQELITMALINGVLLDESNQKLYVYGSSLRVFNLDLSGEKVITPEGSSTYQQCLYTTNLIICKTNTNTLSILSKKTYAVISNTEIKNQPNTFKIYIDEANGQIFLATTFLQIFDFTGNAISQITSIALNILDLQIFGSHIAVMTSTYIFVFTRKDLALMKNFKPSGGGNIKGYYYIADYNLIAYYSDEIRYGQVFYFSLTNYLDDGFSLGSYPELGLGSVVTLFYDTFTSRLQYLDSQGVFYSVNFLSQRSFYNVVNFEDFKTYGAPTDMVVDQTFNTLYVYNKKIIMKMNYNINFKYVINQSEKTEKFYFKYLPQNSVTVADSSYYIFDKYNILYSYKDFAQIYRTYFTSTVRNVKQIDKYQLVIVIFDNEILLYTYDQVAKNEVISSNFVAQIIDPKIRRFFTDELLLTTEQELIHINYQFFRDGTNEWKKKVISYSQFDESLRNFIKYGTVTQEKVFISFSSGRILFYDQVTMQDQVILPAWTPQGGITTNFVKYFFKTDNYLIVCYFYNFLTVISLSNFQVVKTLDASTLTLQTSNQINTIFADEKNNRYYVSFMYQKLIYVLNLQTLAFETYLAFPNDQFNRITVNSNYLFAYSNAQVNIFKRDTLKFVNMIKKSNSENKILSLTIVDQNKIVLAMNVLLEIYLFNADQTITLIDSSSIKNPEIAESYLQESDKNILRIVGISDSSIFEKRINMKMFTSTSVASTSASSTLRYSCYSSINMNDRIIGENLFSSIYDKSIKNRDYRIVATFGQDIKSLDFITDPSVRVIIYPDPTNTNKQLNMLYNSFMYIQRKIVSFSDFSLIFKDNNKKYNYSTSTQKVIWQSIKIENQDLEKIQIIFSSMQDVTISNLSITGINYNSASTNDDALKKWDQTLFLFKDCTNVIINNITITDLHLWKRSLLLGFQRVSNIQINNFTIKSSNFYQLIAIEKGDNLTIKTMSILNNVVSSRIPYGSEALQSLDYIEEKQEQFMVSIVGVSKSSLSGITMKSNTNILFLQYVNSFKNENEKVILYNDSITISDSAFQDTTTSVDSSILLAKQINQALFSIQATTLNVKSLQYLSNEGNVMVSNSNKVTIEDSTFQNNNSLDGGAINFNTISDKISIINTKFIKNSAKGSGGGLFLKEVESITFDINSLVSENSAQIGGGIRIISTYINPNNVLVDQSKVINNIATIFGKNIGTYPTKLSVELGSTSLLRQLEQSESLQEQNQLSNETYESLLDEKIEYIIDLEQSHQRKLLNSQIKFDNFRSGDYLPLNIKLMDTYDQIVSFSLQKIKEQQYASSVQEELKSLEFDIVLTDVINISVNGQTFLNYNQFNEQKNIFQFTTLKVNAQPKGQRSLQLSATTNSFMESSLINLDIFINFRSCIKGEVFKNITEQIITCDVCQSGFYSLKDPNKIEPDEQLNCLKCPSSAEKCSGDKIDLKDGYWREGIDSDNIYECNNDIQTPSCKESNENSKLGCIEGYSGPLCENCDEIGDIWGDRYTFLQSDQSCRKCEVKSIYYAYFILVSIALCAYLLLSVIMFMNNFIFHSTCTYLRYMKVIPMSASCMNDQSTYYMKSLINYLQISSMLLQFNLKSHFTIFINSSNYLGSPSTKVLSDSHCLYPDYFFDNYGVTQVKIFFEAIYPLIFLVSISLMFYICARLKLFNIKQHHNYATLTILFTFFQPELVRYFTEALSCRKIGDKRYVSRNLLIMCEDSSYLLFSNTFVIPYLILLLVIPLYALKMLYKYRKNLEFCTTKYKLGYFYLDYKPNLYFWEFIRIYLKTFIVVFYTLYKEQDQSFAYQIVSLILCLSLILNHIFQPFVQKQVLTLESVSIGFLLVNIILQQLDLIHRSNAIIAIEYAIHMIFILIIVLVIVHLKLNKKQQGKIIYVRNALKSCLPRRVFNLIFRELKDQLPTFIRWLHVRKYLTTITKMQAQKVQALCDTNLSKQITLSQRLPPQFKAISKNQTESIISPYTANPTKRLNENNTLINTQQLYLRNTYSTNLSPSRINVEKYFNQINPNNEEKSMPHDKVIESHDHSLNDIDNISQYEEQPTSIARVKQSVHNAEFNFELSAISKKV